MVEGSSRVVGNHDSHSDEQKSRGEERCVAAALIDKCLLSGTTNTVD